jgi:hypothetical protein
LPVEYQPYLKFGPLKMGLSVQYGHQLPPRRIHCLESA